MKTHGFLTAIGLVIVVVFVAFSGCTKKENPNEIVITVACGAVGAEYEQCRTFAQQWANAKGNIKIEMYQTPNSTNEKLALFGQIFSAGSADIDVVQIDVIWPGILGQYFIDLKEYIPESHIKQHFKSIVDNNTDKNGKILAIPFFTDAGVLYYRKDLLEKYKRKAPQTWEELAETAKLILSKEKQNNPKLVGFVFQGKAYEGLTCNALEWIYSYNGGAVIDDKTGAVTINNPNAIKALKMAASWIGTISPKGVLNYDEESARGVFQSGNAIFQRNWPYVWALANAVDSPVFNKVGVCALPKGGKDGKHTGTLGGWNLAVSKYSKHIKESAQLVEYMTTKQVQLKRAIDGAYNPTVAALYKDKELLKANPFFGYLYDTFTGAVARPSKLTGTKYNQVSNKFWNAVHSVLSGTKTPEVSLKELSDDLNKLKSSWEK